MVPPTSHKVPRVSWYSGSCYARPSFAYGALTLSGRLSQNRSAGITGSFLQSVTPWRSRHGLGSSAFARRYLRNRCFFLFLRVLRCFSSPGSPPCVMDWRMDTQGVPAWVSPFRDPWIKGYLRLPMAYRSLSRLSSALSAKASALCPFCLTICILFPSVRTGGRLILIIFLITLLSMSFPIIACSSVYLSI